MKRHIPLKPVNSKRRSRSFDRAYGGDARTAWIAGQPCLACGKTPSENAHVTTGGMGRKADARWIVPLCAPCHLRCHKGRKTFEAQHNLDLGIWAVIIDARWEQHLATPSLPKK